MVYSNSKGQINLCICTRTHAQDGLSICIRFANRNTFTMLDRTDRYSYIVFTPGEWIWFNTQQNLQQDLCSQQRLPYTSTQCGKGSRLSHWIARRLSHKSYCRFYRALAYILLCYSHRPNSNVDPDIWASTLENVPAHMHAQWWHKLTCAVWSEPWYSAWRNVGSLAT